MYWQKFDVSCFPELFILWKVLFNLKKFIFVGIHNDSEYFMPNIKSSDDITLYCSHEVQKLIR